MKNSLKRAAYDYGMVFVLLLLCAFFSLRTITDQYADGGDAGNKIGASLTSEKILIIVTDSADHQKFANALKDSAAAAGNEVLETISGQPTDARKALDRLIAADNAPTVIAGPQATMQWDILTRNSLLKNTPT